nr:MAG TPA: hypothetical protein [Caudoviricetes sp.]
MTREEKLNALGVKPLGWKFSVCGGFVQHKAYTYDPYEKDLLRYKIEVKDTESEDYYAYLIRESRAGTYLLAKELSLDASVVNRLKEKAEDDLYKRIVRGAEEADRRAQILKDKKEEEERHTLECAKRLISEITPHISKLYETLLSETTNKEEQ